MNIDEIIDITNVNTNLENTEIKNLQSFYINTSKTKLWKSDSTNRPSGNVFNNQNLTTNIILTKCASWDGLFDEKFVLIKHSELNGNGFRFFNVLNERTITEDILNFYLNNQLIDELIIQAIGKEKLQDLINDVIEQEKLQDFILACSSENKNKILEYSNVKQLHSLATLVENGIEEFINEVKKKLKNFNYKQHIIYGPAGVGKTYSIRGTAFDTLDINDFEKQTIHTVFHPESSYYDFFGKVMPVKDSSNNITYEFLPGPFSQALERAYENIKSNNLNPEKVLLVIDELNRGNAASIFGGLFNLLDRNENGVSEYPLNIYGMEANWLHSRVSSNVGIEPLDNYVKQYTSLNSFTMSSVNNESLKIFIPHNLSIICTMNTSDQTIFSLDKAFQRRFDKEFKTAQDSIESYFYNDIKIEGQSFLWKDFLKKLNDFIIKNAQIDDVDNATIGAYFVKPKKINLTNELEIKLKDIKYSIMYYLWYDLFDGWKRKEQLLDKLGSNFKEENEPKTFEEFTLKCSAFIESINQ